MRSDLTAIRQHERTGRQCRRVVAEPLPQNLRVVTVRNEADVLALRLLRDDLEAQAVRDGARLRLRARANGEQHPPNDVPVNSPEEVRLILPRIEAAMQRAVDDSRVVSRGNEAGVDRICLLQQIAKLRERVAADAGDRRPSARVLVDEVAHDVAPERALEIQHVVRDAELLTDAARIVDRVERTARPIRYVVTVAEELHRRPNDVVALLHE